jgi:hypothetical protein
LISEEERKSEPHILKDIIEKIPERIIENPLGKVKFIKVSDFGRF